MEDEFVGVVKSVLRSLASEARVIDLTHGIPPHDVRAGALALVRSVQYVAPGVVLAVVDPGVGTDRRAVAVEVGGETGTPEADAAYYFVGPDNGLLASAVAMAGGATRAVELTNPAHQLNAPGPTFAGRDIFAPAAAHLCKGGELSELGPAIDPITLRPGILPLCRREGNQLITEVLWIDRYGNVQLNVAPDELAAMDERVVLHWGAGQVRSARRAPTYGALQPGEVGLITDSYGLVSVALHQRSAAEELHLRPGDALTLGDGSDGDAQP